MPLRRADGYPGAAAALRRGAEIGSQWVFWRLPVSSRQTCGAAAPPSLGTPHPRSSPAAGAPARPCPARSLRYPSSAPAPTAAGLCACSAHRRKRSRSQRHSRDREEQGGSSCYF